MKHIDYDLHLKEIVLDACSVLLSNFLQLSVIFSDSSTPASSQNQQRNRWSTMMPGG